MSAPAGRTSPAFNSIDLTDDSPTLAPQPVQDFQALQPVQNFQHIPASPVYSAQNAVYVSPEMPMSFAHFQHENFAVPQHQQLQPFCNGMSQEQHPQHAQLQHQAEMYGALMMENGYQGPIHNGPNHMAVPQAMNMEMSMGGPRMVCFNPTSATPI
jgi:hypothetical protein